MAGRARQNYIDRHKALGLCKRCPNPALPGLLMCGLCISKSRQYDRSWYRNNKAKHMARVCARRDRLRDEGRCVSCGRTLHPETDEGNVTCFFCNRRRADQK